MTIYNICCFQNFYWKNLSVKFIFYKIRQKNIFETSFCKSALALFDLQKCFCELKVTRL